MQDGCWHFHLFGANFATEVEAHKYVFEQWGIEPLKPGAKPSTFRGETAILPGE